MSGTTGNRGMTAEELKNTMQQWDLTAAQLAKVLCLHTDKVSEYLADLRRIPCSVRYSIQALELLAPEQRTAVIAERLLRKPHHG